MLPDISLPTGDFWKSKRKVKTSKIYNWTNKCFFIQATAKKALKFNKSRWLCRNHHRAWRDCISHEQNYISAGRQIWREIQKNARSHHFQNSGQSPRLQSSLSQSGIGSWYLYLLSMSRMNWLHLRQDTLWTSSLYLTETKDTEPWSDCHSATAWSLCITNAWGWTNNSNPAATNSYV